VTVEPVAAETSARIEEPEATLPIPTRQPPNPLDQAAAEEQAAIYNEWLLIEKPTAARKKFVEWAEHDMPDPYPPIDAIREATADARELALAASPAAVDGFIVQANKTLSNPAHVW
jgi:hypothetical protein